MAKPKKLTPKEDKPKKLEEEIPTKLSSQEVEDDVEYEEESGDGDYLRQYQYKKVNNRPMTGGELTDPDKGSKAERMKAALLEQESVTMLIPLPEGTDPKIPYSVSLNGYRLDFPTNTYIQVPKQVAEVISEANNQTRVALEQFKIGGNKKKEDALQ